VTNQLSLLYEPSVLPNPPFETFIERVPSNSDLPKRIEEWKILRRSGWDLTALLAPDSKTVLALGCRGAA
jgi:hypothetical protein